MNPNDRIKSSLRTKRSLKNNLTNFVTKSQNLKLNQVNYLGIGHEIQNSITLLTFKSI
jgi:hypothetical protein